MSDPRFARLKTDPRFRRIRKHESKVVVDERFKDVLTEKKGKASKGARVDKYGRPLKANHEKDNLRRFYRLEDEDGGESQTQLGRDYARGDVLMESSSEEGEDEDAASSKEDGDESQEEDGFVTLGGDYARPIPVPVDDDEAEIDLDESTAADLEAQALAYQKTISQSETAVAEGERTRRIAVVNLDWDHVRAVHLYKVFSSLVSPTAPSAGTYTSKHSRNETSSNPTATSVVKGRILNVRVYPSEFGKERMAREEKEGPPPEIFKRSGHFDDAEQVNEKTIFNVGEGEEYDEDALRKYQLERLRYYYAIVTCDSVSSASHVYDELDGTEFERSANVFDLSFVPEDMTFEGEFRDEATEDSLVSYKGVDFVTDALRHSKVKLTWDDDDAERSRVTRRTLTKQEMEDNDFRAYLASSGSESEAEPAAFSAKKSDKKAASRDKLRALLLGGNDELPEGWGGEDDKEGDVDMEITFTPALSGNKQDGDETTLEKYQRKAREKRKKKESQKEAAADASKMEAKGKEQDDFFGEGSDDDGQEEEAPVVDKVQQKSKKRDKADLVSKKSTTTAPATAEELALLAVSDNPDAEPQHFDIKAIIKAEKKKRKGKKGKKAGQDDRDLEIQEDFAIDVKDDRFKAVHEDHTFAIDPSNPQFKKTKSMAALLEERSKRQRERHSGSGEHAVKNSLQTSEPREERSLANLVESVKRKSSGLGGHKSGKRRKLEE